MASDSRDSTPVSFPATTWWQRLLSQRFDLLLINLLLLFLLVPILYAVGRATHPLVGQIGATLWFAAIVSSAVLAVSDNRKARFVAIGIAVPTILSQVFYFCMPAKGGAWTVFSEVTSLIFLGYTLGLLLQYLFRIREVTANAIWASICVYLLLGMLWATAYQLVVWFTGSAFTGPGVEGMANGADPVALVVVTNYFSFTTLTTLGYGDIVPAHTTVRMLAVVEAVTGQVYLAVLVARLVGIYAGRSRGEPPHSGGNQTSETPRADGSPF